MLLLSKMKESLSFSRSLKGLALGALLKLPIETSSFSGIISPIGFPKTSVPGSPSVALLRQPFLPRSQVARDFQLFAMQRPFENVDETKEDSYDAVPEVHAVDNNLNEGRVAQSRARDDAMSVHPMLKEHIKYIRGVFPGNGKSSQRSPRYAAAALFMMTALFAPLQDAQAAPTGGRIGGSFGGGSARAYTSRSYSAPSRSYASPNAYSQGYTQGYSTGYISRPSVTVAPFGGISPYGGYGLGYNPLLIPRPMVARGPGLFFGSGFFPFAVFSWFLLQSVSSVARPRQEDRHSFFQNSTPSILGRRSEAAAEQPGTSVLGSGVTVAQISIALEVQNRDDPSNILNYLNRLSQSAKTDSRKGVASLVNQVAVELLQQKRSIFASNTSYKEFRNADEAQRAFNSVAVTERSKFERETVSKSGGVDYGRDHEKWKQYSGAAGGATTAVVTLIIAIDGDNTKLPAIDSVADVEKALIQIATDVKLNNVLRSAEILWTPEERDDVMTRQEVFMDYPKLRNI